MCEKCQLFYLEQGNRIASGDEAVCPEVLCCLSAAIDYVALLLSPCDVEIINVEINVVNINVEISAQRS